MHICIIGCWYRNDIYSHNCHGLLRALLKEEGSAKIRLITSNCNCFSSVHRYSIANDELLDKNCDIVKIPYVPLDPSKRHGLFKYFIIKKFRLNFFFESLRGLVFYFKTQKSDLIHFDQVLMSFGILSFITMLIPAKITRKKIIITIHELDPLQKHYKVLNKCYNFCDKITVFSNDFKETLIQLGVKKDKIEIVPYGVAINPLKGFCRDQFVFFGGHKLFKGKGFDTLLSALKILEAKGRPIKLLIYVGEGCVGFDEGKKKACEMELDKIITWSDFLYGDKLAEVYQKSIACIIPYTSGSGRYPATTAMANATPVIATRKANLPEYLEELGIYVKDNSSQELAEAMMKLMNDPHRVKSLGNQLRKRAETKFSWEVISKKTYILYRKIQNQKNK